MQQQQPGGTLTDEVIETANAVAEDMDARVFVYSGAIDNDGLGHVVSLMEPSVEQPHRDNSLLILTTHGGDADAAYKIARCSIPDDQIDPRRSGLFMARSILREIRDGGKTC